MSEPIRTREQLVQELHKVYVEASNPIDQLRALDRIAKLHDIDSTKSLKRLRQLSEEELYDLVLDVVVPALKPYGIRAGHAPA